jgi:hypothetical protein
MGHIFEPDTSQLWNSIGVYYTMMFGSLTNTQHVLYQIYLQGPSERLGEHPAIPGGCSFLHPDRTVAVLGS